MADVPMTRAEAVRLIEAHEHVVRRWAGAHHDKIEEAIDAQVQSRKALIDALTRPAPSASDVEAVDELISAVRGDSNFGTKTFERNVSAARAAVLARMATPKVREGWADLLRKVPLPPKSITYEKGWELLDELQALAVAAAPAAPIRKLADK